MIIIGLSAGGKFSSSSICRISLSILTMDNRHHCLIPQKDSHILPYHIHYPKDPEQITKKEWLPKGNEKLQKMEDIHLSNGSKAMKITTKK